MLSVASFSEAFSLSSLGDPPDSEETYVGRI